MAACGYLRLWRPLNGLCSALKDPNLLLSSADSLNLSDFGEGELGLKLVASSKEILAALGKADQTLITPQDAQSQEAIVANTRFNGDGVVPLAATDDEQLQALLNLIMKTQGESTDLSGKPGINQDALAGFFTALHERLSWLEAAGPQVKPSATTVTAPIKPFGGAGQD